MTYRTALLATIAVLAPIAAFAQPATGLYIAGGAGANFMQDQTQETTYRIDPFAGGGRILPRPAMGGRFQNTVSSDVGATGVLSVGYGFGNGLRLEAEGSYRYNAENYRGNGGGGTTAREQKYGGMVNALFDLDVGSPYVFPYFGAGVGAMHVNRLYDTHENTVFAYQGIGGLAFPIPNVPGLSATLEYRFLGLADSKYSQSFAATPTGPSSSQTNKFLHDYNHSLMVGVRYVFGVTPPPAAEAPAPAPQASASRTYLVFFDWDRADLTARARQIIAEAARASTGVQATRIDVQGNADRTGTAAYNQRLSLRRAQVVSAELVRDGVPAAAISVEGFGDTRPLVPTAAGVREPQNRRVAIILH